MGRSFTSIDVSSKIELSNELSLFHYLVMCHVKENKAVYYEIYHSTVIRVILVGILFDKRK